MAAKQCQIESSKNAEGERAYRGTLVLIKTNGDAQVIAIERIQSIEFDPPYTPPAPAVTTAAAPPPAPSPAPVAKPQGIDVAGGSIDDREISFTVNGEVRSYPRADVWRVTFGEARVKLGQTIDEVKTALGPPKNAINNGVKTIYVYTDTKITFIDGKVSAIE